MSFTGPSLRDRLRTGTRAAQDGLERAQKVFDLGRADHLGRFLAAQRDALATLKGVTPELDPALGAAEEMLVEDLGDLGDLPDLRTYPRPKIDHRFAGGYVWHSQQLALRMLVRRLPDTARAGLRFLTAPRDAAAWRALCDELERTPGYEGESDAAVRAANDRLALLETIHIDRARAMA